MALVWACAAGCSNSTGQVGSHFRETNGTAMTNVANSVFRSGRAWRSAGTNAGSGSQNSQEVAGLTNTLVMRVNCYFSSAPTANTLIGCWAGVFLGQVGAPLYNASDGKIYAAVGSTIGGAVSGATGVTMPIGRVFRIDFRANQSANPRTFDVSVDGVACGQTTFAGAATNINYSGFGTIDQASSTYSYDMSDFAMSITNGDFPIGDGYCMYYLPNADGTHSFSAGDIQDQGGTDINAGSNPAYAEVDELPSALDANLVAFKVSTAGTSYVEVLFDTSQEPNPPLCIDPTIWYKGSAALAYNLKRKYSVDSFATEDLVNLPNATGTTQRAERKAYATTPGGGSAWTSALFNALKLRVGFSTDISPNPQWQASVIEAAYAQAPLSVRGMQEPMLFMDGAGLRY